MWTTADAESDDSDMAEDLGPFLSHRREIAGLTHKEVVAQARVNGDKLSVSTLSAIERGERGISVEMADVIAKALGLTERQTVELASHANPAPKGRDMVRILKQLAELAEQVGRLVAHIQRQADQIERQGDQIARQADQIDRLLALLRPPAE